MRCQLTYISYFGGMWWGIYIYSIYNFSSSSHRFIRNIPLRLKRAFVAPFIILPIFQVIYVYIYNFFQSIWFAFEYYYFFLHQDLYRNVTKHLKRIDQNSRNYMWKYNLLQVWAEKALFRLDVINRRMNETVVDQLFAKMVQILLELGS